MASSLAWISVKEAQVEVHKAQKLWCVAIILGKPTLACAFPAHLHLKSQLQVPGTAKPTPAIGNEGNLAFYSRGPNALP